MTPDEPSAPTPPQGNGPPLRWRDVPVGRVYLAFWDEAAPMDIPTAEPTAWDDWCDRLRDNVRALHPDLYWLPIDWRGTLDQH